MFYLIYISSATSPMDDDDLKSLLEEVRPKNLHLNVTGILIYQDGSFMQMLEGDKQTVLDLYDEICVDNRHKGVLTMMTGDIKERNFEDWSMGFCNMDKEADLPKFGDYLHENLSLRKFQDDSQNAYRFMVKFSGLSLFPHGEG